MVKLQSIATREVAEVIPPDTFFVPRTPTMAMLTVWIGPISSPPASSTSAFRGRLPRFLARISFEGELVEARWSGEAG